MAKRLTLDSLTGFIFVTPSNEVESVPTVENASLSALSKFEMEQMGLVPQNEVSICFVPGDPPDRIVDSELTESRDVRAQTVPGSVVFPSSSVVAIPSVAVALDSIRFVLSIGSLRSVALSSIILIFLYGS